jgi:hypothetical protein
MVKARVKDLCVNCDNARELCEGCGRCRDCGHEKGCAMAKPTKKGKK